METVKVNDLEISLERKRIKNINLRVKPNGKICVSAPYGVSVARITAFVSSKYGWIKSKIQNSKPDIGYGFVNNGNIILFGKTYPFEKVKGNKNSIIFSEKVVLTLKENADENKVLEKFLKEVLSSVIDEFLPDRVRRTGLKPSAVAIRNMKTRWGTCNIKTKKITLSLQLVKKPKECVDYVITHELGHIINRYHDKRFYNYMDNNYPEWRKVKKLLNGITEN